VQIPDVSAITAWNRVAMPRRSFRIGRMAGIPIGISPLWLIIAALITCT